MDKEPLRLDSFYYGFVATGVEEIDLILQAVALAGSRHDHTENWNEVVFEPDGMSAVERIQRAANSAAEKIKEMKKGQ